MDPTDPRLQRFAGRATTRLELSHGDYLIVRAQLTAGDQRAMFARLSVANGDGARHVDPLQVGLALILAYLLDWSLVDPQGAPVPIRGLAPDALAAVVDNLLPPTFADVRAAIEAHAAAVEAAYEAQKKTPSGTGESAVISSSPSAAGGASNGSAS